MSRLIAIFLALTPFGAMASPPKIALVRHRDICRPLPSTTTGKAPVDALHAEILNDPRADQLLRSTGALQTLQAEIQRHNPTAGADGALRDETRKHETKCSSVQSLQPDFETFQTEKTRGSSRKTAEGMRAFLDRIATAQKLGADQGDDGLLDSSGGINSALPFGLPAKDSKDLTDDLTAALSATPVTTAGGPPKSAPTNPHQP